MNTIFKTKRQLDKYIALANPKDGSRIPLNIKRYGTYVSTYSPGMLDSIVQRSFNGYYHTLFCQTYFPSIKELLYHYYDLK